MCGGPGRQALGGISDTKWNYRLNEPPQDPEETHEDPSTQEKLGMEFTKYPGVVSKLGAGYYFRKPGSEMVEAQR